MHVTRSSVTSWFEIVGLLVLVAASAVEVARWSLAGALGTAGSLMILESAFLTWRARPARPGPEVG